MAENYEPLAPRGGTPPPPPPPAAPAAPNQATPAPAPNQAAAAAIPPLLAPKKPANQLPLARKNPKPQIQQRQSSSAVSIGPLPGDDKISENLSTFYADEKDFEDRNSGKSDLKSSAGNYEESVITISKTSKNNVKFYCMITSGIMGAFFALASIAIGIFTFVRL
uniref:Uncharacterized protein n=1 Tax=Panagrolaimus sp. ES5 TaxID=591445 RepID=A0AC34FI74_9BILA